MALLTMAEILATDDVNPDAVPCPEWGGEVNVYPLTPNQHDEMAAWWQDNPSGRGYDCQMVSLACRDLKATPDDVLALQDKSYAVVRRLSAKAEQISKPDYERLVKNSEGDGDAGNG